jgi:hypothetical protein
MTLPPDYVQNLDSSIRTLDPSLNNQGLFKDIPDTYDAFEKDVAMVNIVYQESTVIQAPFP